MPPWPGLASGSTIGTNQAHGETRAGCFGVAAEGNKRRRHPAAFQPRDCGLGRTEPLGKLRLRQLRRRPGPD